MIASGNLINTESQHQGTVKKREEFVLRCGAIISLTEGYYVAIVKLYDLDNNEFIWFASREVIFELNASYRVRATVKKHGEFRGVKQTVILRPKIIGPYIAPIVREEGKDSSVSVGGAWASL